MKRNLTADSIEYGTVRIARGEHKGRIGTFDDESGSKAVVYFGNPVFSAGHRLIPLRSLVKATIVDLLNRRQALYELIGMRAWRLDRKLRPRPEEHIELLAEYALIQEVLAERYFLARLGGARKGRRVFMSHSSRDKPFVLWLASDLAELGFRPWLDEWQIRAGESIPSRISEGLEQCESLVVVLSPHAVESNWVEREWHAKYWDEVSSGRVQVIPVLLSSCRIPQLLKTKKYANFSEDYNEGLEQLLFALSAKRRRSIRT